MTTKYVEPSINETAFNCPHCGAYTTQHWKNLYTKQVSSESKLPHIPSAESLEDYKKSKDIPDELRATMVNWVEKMLDGDIFTEKKSSSQCVWDVNNLHLSQCYNCGNHAVWRKDSLLYPTLKEGALPNQDLDKDIIQDFEEARGIVNDSPRGAAALLRLCIQKLCKQLGEKGKNIDINNDIASLVSKGLDPLIVKTLDIVRVIGNEAVHPGVIDLKDDRDTALKLFVLVNSIADQMITHPKNIKKMYNDISPEKRAAAEKRNEKAQNKE